MASVVRLDTTSAVFGATFASFIAQNFIIDDLVIVNVNTQNNVIDSVTSINLSFTKIADQDYLEVWIAVSNGVYGAEVITINCSGSVGKLSAALDLGEGYDPITPTVQVVEVAYGSGDDAPTTHTIPMAAFGDIDNHSYVAVGVMNGNGDIISYEASYTEFADVVNAYIIGSAFLSGNDTSIDYTIGTNSKVSHAAGIELKVSEGVPEVQPTSCYYSLLLASAS